MSRPQAVDDGLLILDAAKQEAEAAQIASNKASEAAIAAKKNADHKEADLNGKRVEYRKLLDDYYIPNGAVHVTKPPPPLTTTAAPPPLTTTPPPPLTVTAAPTSPNQLGQKPQTMASGQAS